MLLVVACRWIIRCRANDSRGCMQKNLRRLLQLRHLLRPPAAAAQPAPPPPVLVPDKSGEMVGGQGRGMLPTGLGMNEYYQDVTRLEDVRGGMEFGGRHLQDLSQDVAALAFYAGIACCVCWLGNAGSL